MGKDVGFHEFIAGGIPRTVDEVLKRFGVSRITAFRWLKKNGALTSINGDGQYYHLPLVDGFNQYGLMTLEGKVFFRGGNLLQALVHLTTVSRSGMTAAELGRLTGTNVQLQLRDLYRKGKVWRKKYGREYCYFAEDASRREVQLEARMPSSRRRELPEMLEGESPESMRQLIMVILAYLNNPGLDPKSIALSILRRGMDIRTEVVKGFFEKYDIAKKK